MTQNEQFNWSILRQSVWPDLAKFDKVADDFKVFWKPFGEFIANFMQLGTFWY